MCHNKSGRYESRFSSVKINSSKSIMFKNMDESILGVWIAHAEGNLYTFKNLSFLIFCFRLEKTSYFQI